MAWSVRRRVSAAAASVRRSASASACAARSSSVSARWTSPVRMPLLTLISSRAAAMASGGSESAQVRWPFWVQQYSFLPVPPLSCAATGKASPAASATSTEPSIVVFTGVTAAPCCLQPVGAQP